MRRADPKTMRMLIRIFLAAVIAVAFNAIVRTLGRQAAHVPDAFDPFSWPPIIVATLAGVAGGALVYVTFRATLRERGERVFIWLSAGILLLSLITPITLLSSDPPQYPGTSPLTVAALELMHVNIAVATIVGLTFKPQSRKL